jgi:hypothetical protein
MHAIVRYPVIAISSLVFGWLAAIALCFVADSIVGVGSGIVCGHNGGIWILLFWIVSFVVLAVLWRPGRVAPLLPLPQLRVPVAATISRSTFQHVHTAAFGSAYDQFVGTRQVDAQPVDAPDPLQRASPAFAGR